MHDKRHDPGDRHLEREHGHGVARAQLALDGADGRHARRVPQRKDQEHVGGKRRKHGRQCRGRRCAQKHRESRDDALLGNKSGNERRRCTPVAKAERRQHRRDDAAKARKEALRLFGDHVKANVERLEKPDDYGSGKDDGEGLGDKVLGLIPCQHHRRLDARQAKPEFNPSFYPNRHRQMQQIIPVISMEMPH